MSRQEARINLILDEIVRLLGEIDGDPDLYLSAPKTVLRWSADPLSTPRPAIFVRCTRWGPNEPQTGREHDAQADIEIEVIAQQRGNVDDPDRELHRVCADVISVIESNWQLENSGVTSLQIHVIEGYEPSQSLGTGQGLASATIKFKALWPWNAANP